MTTNDVLMELEAVGSPSIKKVLLKHNIPEPLWGVKVEDLKKVMKKTGADHTLALELYDTGIYDARYLAGLIAEPARMSRENLQHWVEHANAPALHEYTVAWVAAESGLGLEMAAKWIKSEDEGIASTGWATLSSLAAITPDKNLDTPAFRQLLSHVVAHIHQSPNRVRQAMNSFVIAIGTHISDLHEAAREAADQIGVVTVDQGDTACKVPDIREYLDKAAAKGQIGKKKKSARC